MHLACMFEWENTWFPVGFSWKSRHCESRRCFCRWIMNWTWSKLGTGKCKDSAEGYLQYPNIKNRYRGCMQVVWGNPSTPTPQKLSQPGTPNSMAFDAMRCISGYKHVGCTHIGIPPKMCLEDDFPIVHGHLLFPCLTQWVTMAGCFSNHETVATVWRSFLAIRHLLSIPGDLQIELDVVACNTALTVCDVQWQRALDILQQTQDSVFARDSNWNILLVWHRPDSNCIFGYFWNDYIVGINLLIKLVSWATKMMKNPGSWDLHLDHLQFRH